jgi:hypothetical protein
MNHYPVSRAVYAPAALTPDTETMTQWSPYGNFIAEPYYGGHDPLSEQQDGVMHVPQSDLYDVSPNPWPNNAQYDRPNFFPSQLIRLVPTTSAHPGFSHPVMPGPTMLFHAPPIFSVQTTPIPATGV